MALLSQALHLGYLLSPHRAFQGHAAHTARWPTMLSPNGSSDTCISDGVFHIPMPCFHGALPVYPQVITTFLHNASRRTRRAMHASCDSPWHLSAKPCVLGACFSRMAPFRTRFSPCNMAYTTYVQRLIGCLHTQRLYSILRLRFHGAPWRQNRYPSPQRRWPRALSLSNRQHRPSE